MLGKLSVPGCPTDLDNQLLQLCTAHTAWSESDQAAQAVHSCEAGDWIGCSLVRFGN